MAASASCSSVVCGACQATKVRPWYSRSNDHNQGHAMTRSHHDNQSQTTAIKVMPWQGQTMAVKLPQSRSDPDKSDHDNWGQTTTIKSRHNKITPWQSHIVAIPATTWQQQPMWCHMLLQSPFWFYDPTWPSSWTVLQPVHSLACLTSYWSKLRDGHKADSHCPVKHWNGLQRHFLKVNPRWADKWFQQTKVGGRGE